MNNKEIGGFFELELDLRSEYYPRMYRFNSARSALFHLLKARPHIKKVYLPYYFCDCVFAPLKELNICIEFYQIDKCFSPCLNKINGEHELLIYINYFGIANLQASNISNQYNQVIMDNTQAFFSRPLDGIDTIYSPRKFFGVPDGGYLHTSLTLEDLPVRDTSYSNLTFLGKRIDLTANESYKLFVENEERLSLAGYKGMSKLTERILQSIDYQSVKTKREENFMELHRQLADINELQIDVSRLQGPMVYPLLLSKEGVREFLISQGIYVATYWKEVLKVAQPDWFEYKLAKYLLPLPIDQRYSGEDMKRIVKWLKLSVG